MRSVESRGGVVSPPKQCIFTPTPLPFFILWPVCVLCLLCLRALSGAPHRGAVARRPYVYTKCCLLMRLALFFIRLASSVYLP